MSWAKRKKAAKMSMVWSYPLVLVANFNNCSRRVGSWWRCVEKRCRSITKEQEVSGSCQQCNTGRIDNNGAMPCQIKGDCNV
jgi:hypothetical protein